ncbi:ATP-binding protein [Paenibacillus soyae]|uniref:ATP-binding protein n=1 Tax=Paenibacillus soyae TaxID=2969249 RepID=A0A9X2MU55_9BACL|nr:ATP-binding protein [Paenibacillus soyae]MCR2806545.1 ATP-binding protein [Paenibacillus soyae]
MKEIPVALSIPAKAEYLDMVRAVLFAVAGKTGFSYEEIEDMKVAVTEACTNAILHAYGEAEEGSVHLTFSRSEGELCITVRDDGRSYLRRVNAPSTSTLHGLAISEATVGGLGIFMMEALMDEVKVKTENGTEVVLIKRMSRNEEMV